MHKYTECGLGAFQEEEMKNGNFFQIIFIVFYNVPNPKVLFDYSTKILVLKYLPWDLLKKPASFIGGTCHYLAANIFYRFP